MGYLATITTNVTATAARKRGATVAFEGGPSGAVTECFMH
jgi:hypothetical protein